MSVIAIVGRPNVGKSTLFNRLIGARKAIVDDVSGVTRDRHYGTSDWNGKQFTVIDTGGYVNSSEDVFEKEIKNQVKIAITEADVLLFMVDVTCGITDLDADVAKLLRKAGKPVLVVINKVDNNDRYMEISEFYSLGFDQLFPISSVSGSGTGELLDEAVKFVIEPVVTESTLPRIAIVGRPNVGKSSLTNALLGEERNIVTDIPGTTRDTIHSHYKAFGKEFLLIDTAGIRKKGKVREDIEFYSVMRSLKAIEETDVVVLMIDAEHGFEGQDQNLFHLAEKNGKGIMILVNKWDLVEGKNNQSTKTYTENIKKQIAPFTDVPILFISVKEKQRIFKAVELAIEIYDKGNKKIPTHELNEFLLEVIEETPPPANKGKYIKIKYVTQLRSQVVSFALFCNLPQYIKEPYKRFLENRLREQFDFTGVPIRLFFRKK